MAQCARTNLSGGRCELNDGHDGSHRITKPTYTYEWTDESEAVEADRLMRRTW